MGHVDDAHQAVGDGQAEGHQQQDGAEADAGEQHAQAFAPGQPSVHLRDGVREGAAQLGVGLGVGREARLQQRAHRGLAAVGQQLDRLQALRAVGRGDLGRGLQALQARLQAGVGFPGDRLVDHGQQRRIGVAPGQVVDRGSPRGELGRHEAQSAQRRLQRAAHAVVVGDVLGVVGQLRGLARDGVDRLVVVHDEDAGGGGLHGIVEQRLRERGQAGIGPRHRVLQGRDARVAVADGDRARLGRVERPGGGGDHDQHRRQRDEGTSESESPHRRLTSSRARPSCPYPRECTGSTAGP